MTKPRDMTTKAYDRADVLFLALLLVDEVFSDELIEKLNAAIDIHLPLTAEVESNDQK